MNIAENLALLAQTKENIRQAINRKGVVLESSAPFSAYSAAIMAIETASLSLYAEVEASVASPAFYVTGIPSPQATSSNYYADGYVIGIGKTEGFEPWSDDTFNFNNDVLVCEFFKKNNQDIYCAENSEHYTGGGIALNAAHMTELRYNNRLPIDVTSGGTYYVAVWKFHKVTSGTGDPYVLDEQLPVTISAATPTPEPVNYTYALSMDNGANYGAGELDGAWDDSIGAWTRKYVDLYYGTGDWEQGNFVSSGTVSPSAYSLENNPDGAGVQDTNYNVGFDNEQGKWYIQANDNTVNYSDQGEFFCVKATSGNSVDISGATMTVNIGTVDARPEQGGDIPEGLWKFDISQSQWPDCAMMVEAYFNPYELKKGETGSQTVNIYTDPSGEPVNTITYDGYVIGGAKEMDVQNTNANAGVYCTNSSDWTPYISNPLSFKLECRTAGKYYIEVVDHANPKFYDVNGTQIYPNNYSNS